MLNAETSALYQNVRAYTPPLQFKASFDVERFVFTDLIDPVKTANTLTYIHAPLPQDQAHRVPLHP